MSKWMIPGMLLLLMALVVGCTAGPNDMAMQPDDDGRVAGFGLGLWHGLISPITFVISLFNEAVKMYEVHNTGGWYDFGFLLGVMTVFGGGGGGAASRRK